MSNLRGKKILLGVSGSIAAYKSAFLIRLLIKAGAEVQVLMTSAAANFISPLTLSTLSKKSVFIEITTGNGWNNHVELGLWADAMVVAPATATTIAKMSIGLCDSMVVAAYLSARCPVFIAPAMDVDMWLHPATQRNITQLQSYGNHLLPVEHGELASGLVGLGRMAEPETIVQFLDDFFAKNTNLPLAGKNALVTAGPTYEPIDPVRFIGNRSSGKMGVAIAQALAAQGARVQLILGPSRLDPTHSNVHLTKVETAAQMYEAANAHFSNVEIAVLSAAVADYRPKHAASEKIKKQSDGLTIELEKTHDIAAELGKRKQPHQLIVGFALETNDEMANAQGKLIKKNFDFVVLNSLKDEGAGFHHDTNKVTFLDKNNKVEVFELKSKTAVADDIVAKIVQMLNHDAPDGF